MDFLDDPVAIHSSRTTYSRFTKDAIPNEYIDPEILMENHDIFTYSFAFILPTIFPDTLT